MKQPVQQQASLQPLAGAPADVRRLLADWLSASSPPPLVVRTSGSTGEPKDVALSVTAVRASAEAALRRLGGPGQWVLALPPHYVAGMQVLARSVLAGTTPVVLEEHDGLASAAAALTDGRRYLALVPTQLHRLLAIEQEATALAGFDAVLLGGAAATDGLLAAAQSAGVRVVTTYGMSETGGGCVYDGVPLDDVGIRVDPSGRVLVSGPVLFDGYVGRPDLTAEVLRDGWLRTPDTGRLDADGRLEVLGRVDDVVVSGGVNVSLGAVERRLLEHPALSQVAVVAVPDPTWGALVVAHVVPRNRAAAAPGRAELRDFVAAGLPRPWAPREIVVRARLPLLESGKVDRLALLRESRERG